MKQNYFAGNKELIMELFQPGVISLTGATFFIGVGVAHYLGSPIDWLRSFFICLSLIFLLWGRNMLLAYFDHPESPFCILKRDHARYTGLLSVKRASLLTYSFLLLSAAATFATLTLIKQSTNITYLFFLAVIFIICVITSVPPVFLQRKGYGELFEALTITIFIPAIALTLNYGKIHPILEMITVPILFVYLAVKLAFSFQTYLEDKAGGNPNLLNKLDWLKSMRLHNLLIIIAYVFIPVFTILGLSWKLVWPMFLTFPIAIFEVVQILAILNGAKPNWKLFEWTAGSLIGILTYLVLLTLWLN